MSTSNQIDLILNFIENSTHGCTVQLEVVAVAPGKIKITLRLVVSLTILTIITYIIHSIMKLTIWVCWQVDRFIVNTKRCIYICTYVVVLIGLKLASCVPHASSLDTTRGFMNMMFKQSNILGNGSSKMSRNKISKHVRRRRTQNRFCVYVKKFFVNDRICGQKIHGFFTTLMIWLPVNIEVLKSHLLYYFLGDD